MKVLVTGANGFIGLNIVRSLLDEQHDVVAFIRPTARVDFIKPMNVTLVYGELHDHLTLCRAMEGCDAVIHTAGNTSSKRSDWPLLVKANVMTTQAVTDAALAVGVPRLVYTSTTSTIGAVNDPSETANENTPLQGFRARNPYAQSKIKAEAIVRQACEEGIEGIILNPAEVIGAFDYSMQWGRMVLAVRFNQLPFLPPGGASFCDAHSVGKAHVAALTKGESGKRYILSGIDIQYADLIDAIAHLLGVNVDLPSSFYPCFYIKTWLQEKLPLLTPGEPILDAYRLKVFKGHFYFDCTKACHELGYQSAPLSQMLKNCADWYQQYGFMPPVGSK